MPRFAADFPPAGRVAGLAPSWSVSPTHLEVDRLRGLALWSQVVGRRMTVAEGHSSDARASSASHTLEVT